MAATSRSRRCNILQPWGYMINTDSASTNKFDLLRIRVNISKLEWIMSYNNYVKVYSLK